MSGDRWSDTIRELNDTQAELFAANKRIEKLTDQLDQALQWKKGAMAIEASWSPQEVGAELGLILGTSIQPQILPKIKELRAQLAAALDAATAAATKPLVDALEQLDARLFRVDPEDRNEMQCIIDAALERKRA